MLGTIMASNVAMTIIPSQRQLVASVGEAGGGDPTALARLSARAKRVSIFNNYMTFPVVALMVSNHFPTVYAHRWNWLLLLLIVAAGAAVRHALNLRFTWRPWKPALAATIAASVAALYAVLALPSGPDAAPRAADGGAGAGAAPVTFAEARHVIDRRCSVCHSAQPADLTFGVAPAGVTFDTPAQIAARASRIRERAVVTRTMPPANRTHITDAERALLARWLDQGAAVR
jgi:uncharacterized membrane protein